MTGDERAIVERYLLGAAADADRQRLEERLFKDDELFDEICALDDELVNDYVSDRLSTDQARLFEQRLKTSRELQEDVEFARTLRAMTSAEPAASRQSAGRDSGDPASAGFRGRLTTALPRWPAVAAALAACAVLLLAARAAVQVAQLRTQVRALQDDRARIDQRGDTLVSALARESARGDELARLLLAEQNRTLALEERLSNRPTSRGLVNFVLPFGRDRSGPPAGGRTAIAVSPQTDVRLRVDLPDGDPKAVYRVSVRQVDSDTTVWSQDGPALMPAGAPPAIVVTVPGEAFSPRAYELRVETRNDDGSYEIIASPEFAVTRP